MRRLRPLLVAEGDPDGKDSWIEDCRKCAKNRDHPNEDHMLTDIEQRLRFALAHAVLKDHPLQPRRCDGCLDVAAVANGTRIQGGERQGPLCRIGDEAQ